MSKVAVVTDSNSGITQAESKELGIHVIPMPFYINDEMFLEDIDLDQEQFYEKLKDGDDIKTSTPSMAVITDLWDELFFYINDEMFLEDIDLDQEQFYEKLKDGDDIKTSTPSMAVITDLWDELLKEYDEIVHIPMSSGLSSSCSAAMMLAEDYDGKVFVVDNQRISVTMRRSVLDAKRMADEGKSGQQIHDILMKYKMESSIYIMLDTLHYLKKGGRSSVLDAKRMADEGKSGQQIHDILMKYKMESSIYIMLDTLHYLKKGGRITPAAAALGTLLKLKPVLQIQGEKLDAFAKARTVKQAKSIMIKQIKDDCEKRFGDRAGSTVYIDMAYTHDLQAAEEFKKEVQAEFPDHEIVMNPLSLSVSCHIGPGALAVTTTKIIEE